MLYSKLLPKIIIVLVYVNNKGAQNKNWLIPAMATWKKIEAVIAIKSNNIN